MSEWPDPAFSQMRLRRGATVKRRSAAPRRRVGDNTGGREAQEMSEWPDPAFSQMRLRRGSSANAVFPAGSRIRRSGYPGYDPSAPV